MQSNSVAVSVGNPAPAFTAAGVVNAASYAPAPVSVGEIVVVFGQNFGSLDSTIVLFDSNPAKIIYLTPTQLAATVPATAGNGLTTALQIQTSHDVFSAPISLPITPAAPRILHVGCVRRQAAAINQDNTVNNATNPAPVGSVVALYGTGGGALTSDALRHLSLPVSATIGGLAAQVLYAGVAPGEPDGVNQIQRPGSERLDSWTRQSPHHDWRQRQQPARSDAGRFGAVTVRERFRYFSLSLGGPLS